MQQPDHAAIRKAVTAASIGNVLEWYDFAVYGYVATLIAKNFFPAGSELTALLNTFLTFGLGFLARPLGGIVIGRLGDTHGRKFALLVTIFMMAIGTTLIGLLPTYSSIGYLAPILLLVARLMQGFSAGGEWGGSTAYMAEWSTTGKRGWHTSFQQFSVVMGLMLGSGVAALLNTILPPAEMEAWGWRVPFLLGAILGPVGLYMRRNIDETPAYEKAKSEPAKDYDGPSGFNLAAKAFGFTVIWTVSFYIFLAWMPTFAQTQLKFTRAESLWAGTIASFVLMLCIPLMGALSDKVGRKPLLLLCCLGFVILPYPMFITMVSGVSWTTLTLLSVGIAVLISLFSGPGPAAIAEIFPTRSRSLWMTTGYALSVAIFGGFAPFIATWLISATGSPISPVYYVIACAAISLAVIATLKETAFQDLR